MSRSDSQDEEDVLLQKEKELERLFEQMDELQNEVDQKSVDITNIQGEIQILQKESAKLIKIQKNLQFEPNKTKNIKNTNNLIFEGEHADMIKEKQDIITKLNEELVEVQKVTDPIEFLVQDLQQQQTKTIIERSKVKTRLNRAISERKRANQDIKNLNDQIREINHSILMYERAQKDVEVAIAGLIHRRDAEIINPNNRFNLIQQNEGLQTQIDIVNDRINDLKITVQDVDQEIESQKSQFNNSINRVNKKIGWEREKDKLTNELKETQETLKESKEKSSKLQKENIIIETRLKKLNPVIKKWQNEFKFAQIEYNDDDDEHIDCLIQQYNSKNNKKSKSQTRSKVDIKSLIIRNGELAAIIKKKQEKLARDTQEFVMLQAKIKKDIKDRRSQAFDTEHNIVTNIGKLKLKAMRKTKA
ncbi:hypothetical protein TRFO_38037 [Tritrichomonas foetus]|uniref:Uncharacterized protein n=1 Tax=Tritrichomonas foetus TaxID=1144522 RepID=A0A1J4JC36_9EUKA|nr:hypothetical protein TRFO_38037 [Tritrichomonas foetus]|eukprot:OHS95815.1 hypothetical protein TRFO_38037 [Tritrichomonas foetus]